ncbi:hypothetical protein BsWGS_28268 [Bradybaena similaris]
MLNCHPRDTTWSQVQYHTRKEWKTIKLIWVPRPTQPKMGTRKKFWGKQRNQHVNDHITHRVDRSTSTECPIRLMGEITPTHLDAIHIFYLTLQRTKVDLPVCLLPLPRAPSKH